VTAPRRAARIAIPAQLGSTGFFRKARTFIGPEFSERPLAPGGAAPV
jgi:hypothetical protein